MKKYLIFLVLFFVSTVFGEEFQLKKKLQEAVAGNYLVTTQDKNVTFFFVKGKNEKFLLIEEVNIPASRIPKNVCWKDWFEMGAAGHTSWTQSLLDIETGKFELSYSFTHQGWLETKDLEHFLSTLVTLKFYPIPDEMRRKIGSSPGYGKKDTRPIWHPKILVEGKQERGVYFYAFKARWPNDRTELSGKKIEVYFPEASSSYPTFFPYWVEVEGKFASGRIRVIDAGQNAISPKPPIAYAY